MGENVVGAGGADMENAISAMPKASLRDQIRAMEERELEMAANGALMPADGYTTFLLLLLCEGDIVNARYVWKRIPSEHKSGTVLKSVHAVLAALWRRDWEAVHKAMEANIKHELWATLGATLRAAGLLLLGRAHSAVSPATAATVLGTSADEAATLLAGAGWKQQEGFFVRPEEQAQQGAAASTDLKQLS